MSSVEVAYRAVASTAAELVWLRSPLSELHAPFCYYGSQIVFEDIADKCSYFDKTMLPAKLKNRDIENARKLAITIKEALTT